MVYQSNSPAGQPADRGQRLVRAFGDLLARRRAAAGQDDRLTVLLDSLKTRRRNDDPLAAPLVQATLGRLTVPGGAAAVDPAGWTALARAWQALDAAGKASLAGQLRLAGVSAEPSRDGRYVMFRDATVTAIAEPAADRLRVQRAGRAEGWEGGRLVVVMGFDGQLVTLQSAYGLEVWDADGNGTLDGRPIAARPAPRIAGEPPRRATPSPPPPNELDEPEWRGKSWMPVYGPTYDEAMREAGGHVVEPYRPVPDADVYNCHSFATTGGSGALFDPFMRAGQPHWLDNPMRQLLLGGYGVLAPDQRVWPDDVIVYRKDGKVTHTGVVVEVDAWGNPTKVDSKFGVLGRYVHDLLDVSSMYGRPAEIWRPPG